MIQRIITIITILTLTTAVSHSQQLQLFTNVQGMSQVYDLAFDNEGNVYAAGIASGNAAVVKLDSMGNEIWRNDLVVAMMSNRIAIAQEVFVNDSGQVFVSCAREVGDGAVARLDNTNGNILWKKDDLNTYNRSNSQVGKYSKMLFANERLVLTVESDISDYDYLYFEFNPSNGYKLSSKIIQKPLRIGHKGLRKEDKLYNHMFIGDYPNYSQNQIEIISEGESDNLIFDSINISTPSYHINLIGLHNNKFYGIRNDFDTNKYEFSPTLVKIDSVTGDIISEQNFRTIVDSVTKGTVGLCAMTDDYGILFSGGASTPDSNYNNNIRGFKWIAQVHPQTAEVVWDTLIDMWGEYAYDHLFSNGNRHFLTGRSNSIHELTVPKIGWTPSSTERVTEKKKSKIYPNPASNVLHLEIHNPRSKVMIYTIEGKLMKETRGDQKQLDISDYPSGMYFVSVIEPNNKIETFKIVKK